MNGKIVQIIPAQPGWESVYTEDGSDVTLPLICWALVEDIDDPKYRWISGVDTDESGEVTLVENTQNFIGYRPPGGWEGRKKDHGGQ